MHMIASLYRFTRFDDPAALRGPLLAACRRAGVSGSLLLAREGINGAVAGSREAVEGALAHIRSLPGCADLEHSEGFSAHPPFRRLKVRLKREIVTMGQSGADPLERVGRRVDPEEWNDLLAAPDVAVIDVRNDYEVAIGSFAGAVDPGIASFRDFPAWWERSRERFAGKRIAMFCTGGIRCEKSTSHLLGLGAQEVLHLGGGILRYLRETPPERSAWQGACFVFDGRVSVGHGLAEGPHELCHACRRPILPADAERPEYERGVSCHLCIAETSRRDRARFRERQRQIALAAIRGERHMKGLAAD